MTAAPTTPTNTLRQRMLQDLQLAGLGERTQEAYVRAVRKLAAHYRQAPDQLTEAQVRDYFLYLKNERKFSPSALKIAHSGIKFFYSHTVNGGLFLLLAQAAAQPAAKPPPRCAACGGPLRVMGRFPPCAVMILDTS